MHRITVQLRGPETPKHQIRHTWLDILSWDSVFFFPESISPSWFPVLAATNQPQKYQRFITVGHTETYSSSSSRQPICIGRVLVKPLYKTPMTCLYDIEISFLPFWAFFFDSGFLDAALNWVWGGKSVLWRILFYVFATLLPILTFFFDKGCLAKIDIFFWHFRCLKS